MFITAINTVWVLGYSLWVCTFQSGEITEMLAELSIGDFPWYFVFPVPDREVRGFPDLFIAAQLEPLPGTAAQRVDWLVRTQHSDLKTDPVWEPLTLCPRVLRIRRGTFAFSKLAYLLPRS